MDPLTSDEVSADMTAKLRPHTVMLAGGLVLLTATAAYLVARSDPWAKRGDRLPASFQLDLQDQLDIDPALVGYRQQVQFQTALREVRAIAAGPDDEIYVAGDRAVQLLTAEGENHAVIELEGEPSCLAVGGPNHVEPGRIYVGVGTAITVCGPDLKPTANWSLPGEGAVLTSIALAERDVFVADAGNRLVWRFDIDGTLLGRIGQPDLARKIPGFVVPSAHFDVTVGAEGLVHIVNPGKLQVATFTFEGDLGNVWGRASSTLSGFFGCCNPAHLAMLPDGSFVTSEKGIPRVKVYLPSGEFLTVVAGTEQLGINKAALGDPRSAQQQVAFDIAVDGHGRVLVLDGSTASVRVFVVRDEHEQAEAKS